MEILIAGDYYPNERVKETLDGGQRDIISGEIVEFIQRADLSVVNYESPMTEGQTCTPIKKSGPVLSSNKIAADYIKAVGFGLATLANNHTSDYGPEGLINTISYLNEIGIATVGAGKNLKEAGHIYYKKDVAIINCCEHEFGIAEDKKAGANPLDAVLQYYQIKEARKRAKWIVMIVHGGCEHYQYPTPRMRELYRFFIDAGADVVVNAHQHCFSGYERYQGKPIFYGLGNFCFDRFKTNNVASSWNYGFMVLLKLNERVDFHLLPYCQCAQEPTVKLLKGKEETDFLHEIERLNTVITDTNKLTDTYERWLADNDAGYRYLMRPFYTRRSFLPWLKKIITLYLNKSLKEVILNCIRCESHRERMIYLLEH